ESGSCRQGSAPPGWPPGRPRRGSRGASDSFASAGRLAPACPAEAEEHPELEAQVILQVGDVDQAMDDDAHQREQDAQVERPPGRGAYPPAPPGDLDRADEDPGKRREPEQTGLRPEVEHDVVRIDQVVGVAAHVSVTVNAFSKTRESRSKDRMILQHPKGSLPEPYPLIQRIVWVGRIELVANPGRYRRNAGERQRNHG